MVGFTGISDLLKYKIGNPSNELLFKTAKLIQGKTEAQGA
jgi:hypothetical protein